MANSDKGFNIEIVTPQKLYFSGEVVSVTAPGEEGQFQILKNHAPLLSSLKTGKVKLALDKATDLYESNEHDSAYSNEAKQRSQDIIDTARDEAKKILNEANGIIREIKGYPKTQDN